MSNKHGQKVTGPPFDDSNG